MDIFARIESLGVIDASNLNVRVNFCFWTGSNSVNDVAQLSISIPTPGATMRFNGLVKAALSAYLNARYGISTTAVDVLIPASRGNFVRVPVDFGFIAGAEETTVTVTQAATWVTANTVITCQAQADSFGDHDAEDAIIENITARAINLIPGVSFDVMCYAPEGTWGRYTINCAGN